MNKLRPWQAKSYFPIAYNSFGDVRQGCLNLSLNARVTFLQWYFSIKNCGDVRHCQNLLLIYLFTANAPEKNIIHCIYACFMTPDATWLTRNPFNISILVQIKVPTATHTTVVVRIGHIHVIGSLTVMSSDPVMLSRLQMLVTLLILVHLVTLFLVLQHCSFLSRSLKCRSTALLLGAGLF